MASRDGMHSSSWSGVLYITRVRRWEQNRERILDIVRSGWAWRLLLHDLPPWQMAYHCSCLWRQDGPWQHMHDMLREGARIAAGQHRWRASFDGVQSPIAGPNVQTPAGKHRGCMDGRAEGELPEKITMRTVQRIEESINGAKVDS